MSSHFRLMLSDFLVLAKELICVIKFYNLSIHYKAKFN